MSRRSDRQRCMDVLKKTNKNFLFGIKRDPQNEYFRLNQFSAALYNFLYTTYITPYGRSPVVDIIGQIE
ncbi:Protein of unknown function [Gryllus bimaculatus]|nr:Protein of unknown function [Gryllus bimaculatus]